MLLVSIILQQRIAWGITLRGDERVIGMCGYNYWDRYHSRAEIGFDLAKMYGRRGIGGEAVDAILNFGFSLMNLNRVEAEAVIDNVASVGLLEKLGFQREGVKRAFTLEDDGQYHGSAIYGMLRGEYHPRR